MKGAYTSAAFINNAGVANVAALASIEVRKETDGTIAPLYADKDGTGTLANPFTADANGRFQFYADASDLGYQVKATSGAVIVTARYQPVGSMQYMDAPLPSAKGQLWASVAAGAASMALLAAPAQGYALRGATAESAGMVWSPAPPTVRQTVRHSVLDANGYANFLSAGAALNFNVDAAPTALVLDYAVGYGDLTAVISVDAANQGALVASNTNFIFADYVSPTSVTWGNCLIPPQYGYAFDRAQGALLNFEAADATTTMLDDFGNTWTASGNAQIDTAQFKFGTASLLLDGTGDFISSSNFTTLGDGSWEMSCWFRVNAFAAPASTIMICSAENAAGFGVVISIQNAAGAPKLRTDLSGDGTTQSIGSLTGATTTLVVATWYKARVVFDALAGTYRGYLSNNGAAEVQEFTTSSAVRICAVTNFRIGKTLSGGYQDFNGWVDAFRFVRCATVTGTQTPAAVAPTIADHKVHFFSIPAMTMSEVTAASSSAGVNPALTPVVRVFAGEQDTSGAAVTATRNYALRGEFQSAPVTPLVGLSSSVSANHNIGVRPRDAWLVLVNVTTDVGYVPGDELRLFGTTNATYSFSPGLRATARLVSWATGNGGSPWTAAPAGGGDNAGLTVGKWAYKFIARRGW